MPQRFGGPWSLIKVEAVSNYMLAFTTAFKNLQFRTIYIDAFAGSGSFTFGSESDGPLFDRESGAKEHLGSAKRALETSPPFDRIVFIEKDQRNLESLSRTVEEYGQRNVEVVEGDANEEVRKICQSIEWHRTRGVIFLDPFGNSVEWRTIEAIAKTKLDLWYLFPLSGFYRNAPRDASALTPEKKKTLNRILGTDSWQKLFYKTHAPENAPMLIELPALHHRDATPSKFEAYVKSRLEVVFPLVLEPLTLLGPNNAPMFSLFFAMANDSPQAHRVGRRIAKHILEGARHGLSRK